MPGPAHGGILYAHQWRPGAGVAGTTQDTDLGDFNQDMILIGIELDCGVVGTLNSEAMLELSKPGSRSKYNVFPYIFTLSNLFNAGLVGGFRRELGVLIPKGERLKFTVRHAGTDNLKWLFTYAPPPLDDRDLARALSDLAKEGGNIPQHIRDLRP